jgi:ABC-2 type transport system permease protein
MREVLRDTWVTLRYQWKILFREPVWPAMAVVQPLLYLVLFGPLLEPLARTGLFPPGDAWSVFVPGLLVQLGLFGNMFVGFALVAELRFGTVERMRVTPASRLGLLLGRVLRDAIVLVLQAVLLLGIAAAFGLRVPLVGGVIAIAIVALVGVSLSSLSYAAAMTFKDEDALAALLNIVIVPVLLLSGILLPMSLAPRWLYGVAQVSPITHVVDGARAAFRGDYGDVAVLAGAAAAAGLALVSLFVAARTFRRESA